MPKEYFYTRARIEGMAGPLEDAAAALGTTIRNQEALYDEPPERTSYEAEELWASQLSWYAVKHFSVPETIRPRHVALAKKAGYRHFVPPVHLQPLCGLVVKLCDQIRIAVGRSVSLRNLWRPMPYNRLVAKSGLRSDHPNACGADLGFKTAQDARVAEGYVRGLAFAFPVLDFSMGVGLKVLHVGILSPMGSRIWNYKGSGRPKIAL